LFSGVIWFMLAQNQTSANARSTIMSSPQTDPLFDGMSDWGRAKLAALADAGTALRDNFRATPDDPLSALAASSDYLDLLDSLDGATASSGVAPAESSKVPPADADRTGLILSVGSAGDVTPLQTGDAAKHFVTGLPLVISGAGASLLSLVMEAYSSGAALGGTGALVQYVGIDASQFQAAAGLARLEPNLLKTAAFEILCSCMNEAGYASTIVSNGFACWVVNRALRALPETLVAFAQNLQIDALGPPDVMQDLVQVKQAGLGALCHVQTDAGRVALAHDFGMSSAAIAQLPVDIGSTTPAPG
jgi:hypothetical protein